MAQVKLDISEYELMKENARLLEKSLDRERDLQQKNEELVKEKIKALEEAKMKIVKITKTKSVEHLYRPREIDRSRVFREIERVFNARQHRGEVMLSEAEMDQIQDALFERTVVESTPEEYYETIGLDKAKAEVKADYEARMTEEHRKRKAQVAELTEVLNEKAVLMVDITNLVMKINFFNKKRIIEEIINKL